MKENTQTSFKIQVALLLCFFYPFYVADVDKVYALHYFVIAPAKIGAKEIVYVETAEHLRKNTKC